VFELQPTLSGKLLEMRPLRADDWDAIYALARDPLIWEQHPDRERWREERFRVVFREAVESGGALVAIDRQTGQAIGFTRYHDYRPEKSEIEIGWTFLARSHWGGKYNSEMKDLMVRHAFKFVKTVVFSAGVDNKRSCRAIEKLGAVPVGTKTNQNGGESVVYHLTQASYKGYGPSLLGRNGVGMTAPELEPFLRYTEWEREKWHALFTRDRSAFLIKTGPHGDGRLNTVGEIVRHIFSAELRYPQRLRGELMTETGNVPADDVEAVFALGRQSRAAFRAYLAALPAGKWDTPQEMPLFKSTLMITPRKVVTHTVLHEIRHWAQIATMLRFEGVTDGFHDFLFSPVMGGAGQS